MATMITVPNNCRCSEIKVSPSNWKKASASTKKPWKIHYRFFDPTFDKPHQVIIKAGINKIKDLDQRRALVVDLIRLETEKLLVKGYNPITNNQKEPLIEDSDISPNTLFVEALNKALSKLSIARRTKIDVKSVIKGVETASKQLRLDILPITAISRKHIKKVLEQCGKNNSRWSARRYNLYRAYLLMLYKELVELETVGFNPVRDISKMKEIKKLKTVLTDEQRKSINKHLQQVDYRFWMFIHLFFHSGARLQELTQLKRSDVNLTGQTYKTIIRKGTSYKEVERTIKDVAMPFWEEFIKDLQSEDYLFGVNFFPANKPMVPDTITRRWQKWVKIGLNIQVDLYSLKHLNTTETVGLVGDRAAAQQNAHTTTAMVVSTYDVHRAERQHEILKTVNNKFA
jgi:integrase